MFLCVNNKVDCWSLLDWQVDVAELRQKLQTMEQLEKELELLRRQKAASEQAALNAKQKQGSGGVWGWLAGSPPQTENDAWFRVENVALFVIDFVSQWNSLCFALSTRFDFLVRG